MEAILKFSLLEPEERQEHLQAVNGWKYALVVWELDQYLRKIQKYENKDFHRNELAEEIRTELRDFMYDHGLKLE